MTDRERPDRVAREFSETEATFDEVRAALVNRLLSSPMTAQNERERLYMAVQVLDAVRERMAKVVAGAKDTKAIEEFAASFAATTKDKANG